MKRRWPKEITSIERGWSPWLKHLDLAEQHRIIRGWISRGKRATHRRERREGKIHDGEMR